MSKSGLMAFSAATVSFGCAFILALAGCDLTPVGKASSSGPRDAGQDTGARTDGGTRDGGASLGRPDPSRDAGEPGSTRDASVSGPPSQSADLNDRTFEFPDGDIFGIATPVLLTLSASPGGAPASAFVIRSTANSDEASGTLTLNPCTFSTTTSSFPTTARIRTGAPLTLQCTFDANTAVLQLTDSATRQSSSSISCFLVVDGEETDPCPGDDGNGG